MLRSLLFGLVVASSACAMAGYAADEHGTDGGTDAPDAGMQTDGGGGGGGGGGGVDAGIDSGTPPGDCSQPYSGVLGTWGFNSQPGDEASASGATNATGASVGGISRSSDIVANTGSNSINARNWPAGSSRSSSSGYYTLSITPPSGCTTSLTGMSISSRASSTGPSQLAVATSADGFANATAFTSGTSDTSAMPSLAVSSADGAVEVRVFGWAASGSAGTMRVDQTLTVSGSFQ